VQARQTLEETHWLLDLADATDAIRGWWMGAIAGEDFPGCMEAFDGREKLKGLRHGIQSEKDEPLTSCARLQRRYPTMGGQRAGVRDSDYERHLADTIYFADEHPEQAVCAGPRGQTG